MHLSTSRTNLDNLCLVSFTSLLVKLIVFAIFKLAYTTSSSLKSLRNFATSSCFSSRSCLISAFSRFNSSCRRETTPRQAKPLYLAGTAPPSTSSGRCSPGDACPIPPGSCRYFLLNRARSAASTPNRRSR